MTGRTRLRLALVVPNLASGGGVPAVARFIKDVVVRSGRFDLRVVSLSESSRDPASSSIALPGDWSRLPVAVGGAWEGQPFTHVGAVAGELEFQRYRPRRILSQALADCDLVQVVGGFPAWANAALGLGKPVAIHMATLARLERRQRDASPQRLSDWWRKAMTAVTSRLDDRALRGVDAIQVMNPAMLEYAKGINSGRDVDIRYVPPGVSLERFRPATSSASGAGDYVLSVGRLGDPRKRVDVLLEAFALLAAQTAGPVRLVLAGSTAPPDAFWQRADALGLRARIAFVERPDPAALLRLYQAARVFALSSDEEGFGMVLLESMACGVPAVSTRSGGPDAIITDGEDGFLVERGDAPAMALRLACLLEDPVRAARMGAKARQAIERRYDERVVGDAFTGVWERMARKAGLAW